MPVNDSFSAEYSTIFKREEVVLGKGYPGTEIVKCLEHLHKHSYCIR